MSADTNSKNSRVQPIFQWLIDHGGNDWPTKLMQLADGLSVPLACGPVVNVVLNPEKKVPASAARLAWMIRNASRLAPQDGRKWMVLRDRVSDADAVRAALALLDAGDSAGLPQSLILEGSTHADCLIECERSFVWIEGKRNDWISPSIKWDISRDQLARNVEAVWTLAKAAGKDFCVLICHEHQLKHHEEVLVNGYRTGTWSAGWPHIGDEQRREFSKRIGTLPWSKLACMWPTLCQLPELIDLASDGR